MLRVYRYYAVTCREAHYPFAPCDERFFVCEGDAVSCLQGADGVHVEGLPHPELADGDPALAVFSPAVVSIYDEPPHGSPRNTFAVTVSELEPRDAQVRVRAQDRTGRILLADVTAAAVSELDLYPGKQVHYSVKATAITIYPA